MTLPLVRGVIPNDNPNREVRVTGETITDAQIHLVREALLGVPRKTSYHRSIITDCGAALDGSKACRESVASAYNKMSRGQVKGVPTP